MRSAKGSIDNLIQGVSQQPERERLDGQGAAQVNCRSSALDGLTPRPGTIMKYMFPFAFPTNCTPAIHTYARGDDEQYKITVCDGVLHVTADNTWTDTNGTTTKGDEKTVDGATNAYLNTDDPVRDITFHTLGDVTLVANRQVEIAEDPTTSPGRPAECLIFVKHGNYGSNYSVTIDDVKTTFTTPDGSASTHRTQIATTYIANELETALRGALDAAKYEVTRYEYVVHVKRLDDEELEFVYSDDNGGTDMKVMGRSTALYADLPPAGPEGYVIQVRGTDKDKRKGYWLEYLGEGTWQECLAPGVTLGVDPTTMPLILVRLADGSFKLTAGTKGAIPALPEVYWKPRQIGDDNSNPHKSFVGYRIEDMGSFQSRLYFLADENFVATRTGDFFDFYRESATTETDDDPIDIASSENEVTSLRAAVPFNKALVIFSKHSQFVIDGIKPISPKTIAMPVASTYEVSFDAKPVPAGASVFFPTNMGQFTGIREYFVEFNTETNKADDITSHVPKYLAGRPRQLAASTNFDILFVLCEEDKSKVYVYEYLWQGEKKVLASWSIWNFGEGYYVHNVSVRDSIVDFTVSKGTAAAVWSMDIATPNTQDLTYPASIDELHPHTTYEEGGEIFFDHTGTLTPTDEVMGIYGSDYRYAGLKLRLTYMGGSKFRVDGEDQVGTVFVGKLIHSEYELTMPRVKDRDGIVIEGIRQQMQTMNFTYAKTGNFTVEIIKPTRTNTKTFSGNRLTRDLRIGMVNLQDGSFRVPLRDKVDNLRVKITNDSYLPFKLLHVQWAAGYTIRGGRV